MHKSLRLTSMTVAAALALALPLHGAKAQSQDMPGKGKHIKMARANWDTSWFQAEVYRQMFEKLGYDVGKFTTLANPPFYTAVGNDDVDLWVSGWFPSHNTYQKAFKPGAEKIGYVAKGGALQGYLIDKKTADKYDIKYLSDMEKPKIRKLFDKNGDGKADMIACPPGWGCEKLIAYQMDHYKLRDSINLVKAGYSASMADALASYKQGEPIFFYTWTPNWTVGLLKPGKDVVWLQVKGKTKLPDDMKNLTASATVKNVEGCADNPCHMGIPANDIRPVANKEFLKANPAAKKLLQEMRLPLKDIFAQNAEMQQGKDSQEDIENQATQWINDHQDRVNKWLTAARQAAGKS